MKKVKIKKKDADLLPSILMLLPFFIFFCVFTVYPLIWGFRFMFFEYDGITVPKYIGLENFVRAFTRDAAWWTSVLNTFKFAALKLVIEIPLAFFLAAILNSKIRGRDLFRGIYFMPTVTSTAIISMVFTYLFSSYNGVINIGLKSMGLIEENIRFLEDPKIAMIAAVLVSVWQIFGQNVLFFLSGMQSISRDVYESAEIDGANPFQTFFKITLPLIFPFARIVLMFAIIGSLGSYESIMIMTNGGPDKATLVMGLSLYQKFFNASGVAEYGYGAALSFISSIIIGIFTVIYLIVSRDKDEVQ